MLRNWALQNVLLAAARSLACRPQSPRLHPTLRDRQKVRLSALRGKNVVLVFYPGDDTLICRRQLCEFRDAWPDLRERNTVVLGINPQSAESHREFSARKKFPFSLLVDQGQKVAALYNSDGGLVNRTVYLIGPDGQIRYARRGMPRPEEVLAAAVTAKRRPKAKQAVRA